MLVLSFPEVTRRSRVACNSCTASEEIMSKKSSRTARRAAREAKRRQDRNRRILMAALAVALVAAIIVPTVYFTLLRDSPPATPRLQVVDLEVGEGPEAQVGQTLTVHYTGWLADGTKFDSSVDRDQPFRFTLGAGKVIKGWDQGIVGMKVSGKRKLTIPPELAYGESGYGEAIPPNSTLIFEVELLAIE